MNNQIIDLGLANVAPGQTRVRTSTGERIQPDWMEAARAAGLDPQALTVDVRAWSNSTAPAHAVAIFRVRPGDYPWHVVPRIESELARLP